MEDQDQCREEVARREVALMDLNPVHWRKLLGMLKVQTDDAEEGVTNLPRVE
jgi:hypothetical protein